MDNRDTYFIGYDAREHEAAAVAAYSITRRANRRSSVYMLEHQTLRRLGLFTRSWTIQGGGQAYDLGDGKPFSTAFSHSRFLVFHLARELECTGPCMFVDCDWLFLSDPGEIMALQAEEPHRIGVVMRDRTVTEGSIKMDGMVQENYPRKLWSALFTFMPSDDLAIAFSPNAVNHQSGRDLHSFMGTDADQFWPIDRDRHHIPSMDGDAGGDNPPPKGMHFSEFSPWLNPDRCKDYPTAFALWQKERTAWLQHAARTLSLEPWNDLSASLAGTRA